jgi:hypothetical protein
VRIQAGPYEQPSLRPQVHGLILLEHCLLRLLVCLLNRKPSLLTPNSDLDREFIRRCSQTFPVARHDARVDFNWLSSPDVCRLLQLECPKHLRYDVEEVAICKMEPRT